MVLTAATSKGEKFLWQGHTAGNASEQDTVGPEIIIFICNKVNFAQKQYPENVAAIICSALQEWRTITCTVRLLCSKKPQFWVRRSNNAGATKDVAETGYLTFTSELQ